MFESMQKFAERTGFSYAAIRHFAIHGAIPFVQVGNRRMVNVELAIKALELMSAEGVKAQ